MTNEKSLRDIYVKEMKPYFAELIDVAIGQEDRKIIEKLLQKPWNPYIFRHSLATELLGPKNLNTELAKQWFGWAPKSHMPEIYETFDGHEARQALAQLYALEPQTKQEFIPKDIECPTCKESNYTEALFCHKCNLALTVAGHIEKRNREEQAQKQRDPDMASLKDQLAALIREVVQLRTDKQNIKDDYIWEKDWAYTSPSGGKPEPILTADGNTGRINRLAIDVFLNPPENMIDRNLSEEERRELEDIKLNAGRKRSFG